MQLNQVDGGGGTYGPYVLPSKYGDLKVKNSELQRIGKSAHDPYNQLWDKARVALPGSDSAAADLSKQGFTLGAGLQRVSNRWEEQLKSLMDACAHISNHMRLTKKCTSATTATSSGRRAASTSWTRASTNESASPATRTPSTARIPKKKE